MITDTALVLTSRYLGAICTMEGFDGLHRILGIHLEPPGVTGPLTGWLDPEAEPTPLMWVNGRGWCAAGGSADRWTVIDKPAPRLVTHGGEPALSVPTSEGLMRLHPALVYVIASDGIWGWSLCARN
ncbi:hypothetical protein AB0M43_38645 [Longispora sp. NPDC051575]|uniref:hypothetical protein n=1 Tax=Longispora sp. NPDC051575 TaxID=3154943 RepID=UPI00343EFBC6